MPPPGEQQSREQGPGLPGRRVQPLVQLPGSAGCLPPLCLELSCGGAQLAGGHSKRATAHFPELAGSAGSRVSAWDVSTILPYPINISSCSCPCPYALAWLLVLPNNMSNAVQAFEGEYEQRECCPWRARHEFLSKVHRN